MKAVCSFSVRPSEKPSYEVFLYGFSLPIKRLPFEVWERNSDTHRKPKAITTCSILTWYDLFLVMYLISYNKFNSRMESQAHLFLLEECMA